ncbi:MAG: hypothetical protein HY721_21745, partial [Planctomycetes bacterium]|nr:hypothetical protein [Planctomycetota bacterium]
MSYKVYKFEPGQCTCILGDPSAGSLAVNVRRASGLEAVLDPVEGLRENQYVYAEIKLRDGRSVAVSGHVVTTAAGGILVQWSHERPKDADKLDLVLRGSPGQEPQGQAKVEASGEGAPKPAQPDAAAPAVAPKASGSQRARRARGAAQGARAAQVPEGALAAQPPLTSRPPEAAQPQEAAQAPQASKGAQAPKAPGASKAPESPPAAKPAQARLAAQAPSSPSPSPS